MCYTQFASFCLATGMFAVAYYEWRAFRCRHYSIGLAYFGLMEMLQVVQHQYLAVPEDNYAMCQEPINVILTTFGGIHIAFQPFFLNWALQGLYRRYNLRDRIESDLIQKLQFLGGCWLVVGCLVPLLYVEYTDDVYAPPATEACPDYNWMRDGYDHALNYTTPNRAGYACTYLSPSTNGHLAWVLPQMPGSYYTAGSSIHFFLMFFCHAVLFRTRPLLAVATFVGFLTGPILSAWLTPSVNEQGAVWCFNACIQMSLIAVLYRCNGVHLEGPPKTIVHVGKQGEITLVYHLAPPTTTDTDTTTKDGLERKLLTVGSDEHSNSSHSD